MDKVERDAQRIIDQERRRFTLEAMARGEGPLTQECPRCHRRVFCDRHVCMPGLPDADELYTEGVQAVAPEEPRYCKYCYGEHRLQLGPDGSLLICSNCGAGLAPVDAVLEDGGYDAFRARIEAEFFRHSQPPDTA